MFRMYFQALGRYEATIATHKQAQQHSQSIAFRQGASVSLGNLGNVYAVFGQYHQAVEFHHQQHDIACEIGDRDGEATSLFNIASALGNLKRRPEALQNYQQAKRIWEALNLDFRIKQCQSAILLWRGCANARLQKRFSFGEALPTSFPWWEWRWRSLCKACIVLAIALLSTAWLSRK
jgi:tetratricopeptide (TPR) repeat protein